MQVCAGVHQLLQLQVSQSIAFLHSNGTPKLIAIRICGEV